MSHLIELRGLAGPTSETNTWIVAFAKRRPMNPSELPDRSDNYPSQTATTALSDRLKSLAIKRSRSVKRTTSRSELTTGPSGSEGIQEQTTSHSHGRSMDAEASFRSAAIRDLDRARSIEERTFAAEVVAKELASHSLETIMAIWAIVEDFTKEEAHMPYRKLGFLLLQESVAHSDLDSAQRLEFFRMITVPIQSSGVKLQVRVLSRLTRDGHYLSPFAEELLTYVCNTLKSQVNAVSTVESQKRRAGASEEAGLAELMQYIGSLIAANTEIIKGDDLSVIIEYILIVCEKTASKNHMSRAISIILAVIDGPRIPSACLERCINVLCAVSNAVLECKTEAFEALIKLLKSNDQEAAAKIIMETLTATPKKGHSYAVCGALAMVDHLVVMDGTEGLPIVPFSTLISHLSQVKLVSRRTSRDCLKVIATLLEHPQVLDLLQCEGSVVSSENWQCLARILLLASSRPHPKGLSVLPNLVYGLNIQPLQMIADKDSSEDHEVMSTILSELQRITSAFQSLWPQLAVEQRDLVCAFIHVTSGITSPEAKQLYLSYSADRRKFSPIERTWKDNVQEIVDHYLINEHVDQKTRTLVLQILKDIVPEFIENETPSNEEVDDKHYFLRVTLNILDRLRNEKDVLVIYWLAELVRSLANEHSPRDVEVMLRALWPFLKLENDQLIQSDTNVTGNVISISFVALFLRFITKSAEKSKLVYSILIEIANTRALPASARLPALKLLTRLRCHASKDIVVIPIPDSLGLAATLCRTEASAMPFPTRPLYGDRASTHESQFSPRTGRTSGTVSMGYSTARTETRSTSGHSRYSKPTPPLWMYPGGPGLPEVPPSEPSKLVKAYTKGGHEDHTLSLSEWLLVVIDTLQQAGNWEIYSYVLVHLPSQLSNPSLFSDAIPAIRLLRNVVVSQLQGNTFHEPPANTGVKKGDVALCLYHTLVMLLGYSEHFGRNEQDDMVRTFLAGIGAWDRAAKACIHALAICCHELPLSIARSLIGILQKMSQIITQSHLAMDILEFLGGLGRLPEVFVNLSEDELRTVFGICIRYLAHAREQRQRAVGSSAAGVGYASNRLSGLSGDTSSTSDSNHTMDVQKDLPQYVLALAYHVLTIWFLALRLIDRSKHVGWITKNLAWTDHEGNEIMEEQSQVTLDMMHRTAYLDLGESAPSTLFSSSDGKVLQKSWILGLSIVTMQTAAGTGLSQVIKRQASGTTYAMYQQNSVPLPPHHVPAPTDVMSSAHGPESRINIFPNHVFLQLTSTIAPTPAPMEAICLPDDDFVKRAISAFDRNDTVDGYKVGVIYVGNGQTQESEILANTTHSAKFDTFLCGLGTKVQLKGATFNTQGLDKDSDMDGSHTYAWRDRVVEIVFHIPTLMPTDVEHDPQCVNKKRHIGNDFVNIIFNESGLPFKFDTFPSQFNYVNIVITPEALIVPLVPAHTSEGSDFPKLLANDPVSKEKQQCFTIQTICHPTFPQISPCASYKLLPLRNLSGLARQLALNASVFSNVWSNREGGEHVSSWRNRLREIVKLRERFANSGTSTSIKFPGAKGSKIYVEGDKFCGIVAMGGLAEEEGVLSGLDFSRWAGPNPPFL